MPKITVYLPDDLAEWAKSEGINVSAVTQQALRYEQILQEQAAQVAANRSAGLLDEAEVVRWQEKLRATRSSSTVPS